MILHLYFARRFAMSFLMITAVLFALVDETWAAKEAPEWLLLARSCPSPYGSYS